VSVTTSSTELFDEGGLNTLTAIRAQGCPDCCFVYIHYGTCKSQCVTLPSSAASSSKHNPLKIKQEATNYVKSHCGLPSAKVVCSDRGEQALRALCDARPSNNSSWRAGRSYLVASLCEGSAEGSVRLQGHLRGRPLCVHSLVHVLGVGTARILSAQQAGGPGKLAADPAK